jgi:hypothetical protein
LTGRQAEDCGGPPGFHYFIENLARKNSKKAKEALYWYGGHYGISILLLKFSENALPQPATRWVIFFTSSDLVQLISEIRSTR